MSIKSCSSTQKATQQSPALQYEILMHRLKASEARVLQETTITETLKLHTQDLDNQLLLRNQMIQAIKNENFELKNRVSDLQEQLLARKRSSEDIIRTLRQENMGVKQKNIKMCEIVSYLEQQIEELTQKAHQASQENKNREEGLRKRVEQLTTENQNIRKRMARSEVESEKYKLKALEGEKYWSSKLEKRKQKDQQVLKQKTCNMEVLHKENMMMLKSDLLRCQRLLKLKSEQINGLENKIEEMLLDNQISIQ